MATCEICGKTKKSGNNVSHSHKKTKRVFDINLQNVRIVVDGKVVKKRVCTNCIKSGKVTKA